MKVSENTKVSTDLKTILSIVAGVAVGVWAYFGLHESLNATKTKVELMSKDLEENTEFRIKWPRGEMGSLPADSEQFMMLEDLYKTTDKINKQLDAMMNNRINIEFLQKQMEKVLIDIEALKDKNREMHYRNGNHK
tara:strand:+ start:60 stop:467 length:408 start_codon:yes stop_codon:yes gene_type:complete